MAWVDSVDVGFLTKAEQDSILAVLKRDENLRLGEMHRVTKLKGQLRGIRLKGAKKADVIYPTHICARCNIQTGRFVNSAVNCTVCRHKICDNCRIKHKSTWLCTVCYAEAKIKAESGEWFYEAMRAELKQMSEGAIVLKQAVVNAKSPQRPITQLNDRVPSITCTPASTASSPYTTEPSESDVTSNTSKRERSYSKNTRESNMVRGGSSESVGSSTESHSHQTRSNRQGQVETGTIDSLRSARNFDTYLSDSEYSTTSSVYTSPSRSGHGARFHPSHSTLPSPHNKLPPLYDSNDSKQMISRSKSQTLPAMSSGSDEFIRRSSSICDITPDGEKEEIYRSKSSHVGKRFKNAGKKLISQKSLSKSVPSLLSFHKRAKSSSLSRTSLECDAVVEEEETSSRKSSNFTNKDKTSPPLPLSCCGEINFALEFNYKLNVLTIRIVECRNLVSQSKRCDPYVKCYLMPDRSVKKKTAVIKNTLSPKFNQAIRFSKLTMAELTSRVLELSVWNDSMFTKKSFIGHVQISLDSWKWTHVPHWYPLKPKELSKEDAIHARPYKGDVLMDLCYKPPSPMQSSAAVLIMLKQAKNLVPVRSKGNLNVFAKMCIIPIKDDEFTNVVEGGNNPIWNSTIRLPLSGINVLECAFQIAMYHKPSSSGIQKSNNHSFLGGAVFSCENELSTVEERSIWRKVCDSPGRWITANVPLRNLR